MTSIQKFALVPVVAFSLFLSPVARANEAAAPAQQEASAAAAEEKKDGCEGGCDQDCGGKKCKMKKKSKKVNFQPD